MKVLYDSEYYCSFCQHRYSKDEDDLPIDSMGRKICPICRHPLRSKAHKKPKRV